MNRIILILGAWAIIGSSCKSKTETAATTEEEKVTVTPVTTTGIATDAMSEVIELNATSTYLEKGVIKASSNGYIKAVNISMGKFISANQSAFILKTKEAQSIGNTINMLDTSFRFSGIIPVRAGISGYVTELDHQPGDYVQEGEQLAIVSDINSFVFILNLPYELRPYVLNKNTVELLLPDGKTLFGHIASTMPQLDSISQTQGLVIKVDDRNIPVNLIAKVRVQKNVKEHAISLPKQAVLSDETQSEFWVMKVTNDSTAVKVPVKKGMEMGDRIEILDPPLANTDRFLLTGNYGLEDTARIKIMKQ